MPEDLTPLERARLVRELRALQAMQAEIRFWITYYVELGVEQERDECIAAAEDILRDV